MLWFLSVLSTLITVTSSPLEGAGIQLFSPDKTTTLLVQGNRSGKWGWTKGHRELSDSSWLQTAVREVEEESGFILGFDYYICSSLPHQYGKRLYWQGITFDDEPQPFHNELEHRGIHWIPINQLDSFVVTKDVKEWIVDSKRIECDFI
jgi:8-oxo-dGTP pyrophosphatase MutT (NUDIX family)